MTIPKNLSSFLITITLTLVTSAAAQAERISGTDSLETCVQGAKYIQVDISAFYMYQKISISTNAPSGVCPGVAGAEEEGVGEH